MAALISRSGLDAARAAFFEKLYRGRSVLCVGLGDGAVLEVLLARGAASVAGIDIDENAVAAGRARVGDRARLKAAPVREAPSLGAPFDVVLVRRGETMVARDLWREIARLVRPGGWLIAAALAGDRDGAPRGAMGYAQLSGHVGAYFPHVTMLAQSAFAGAAMIPFGGAEVEPVLDVALAPEPTPELYVAVAGGEAIEVPYGLIELPGSALAMTANPPAVVAAMPTAVAASPAASAAVSHPGEGEAVKLRAALAEQQAQVIQLAEERRALVVEQQARVGKLEEEQRGLVAQQQARVGKLEEERRALVAQQQARVGKLEEERRGLVEKLEQRTGAGGSALSELRDRLAASEHALKAARAAALVHAEQMRASEVVLAERDAYVGELEREARAVDAVREQARRDAARAEQAEAMERAARRRVAELEGTLLRLRGGTLESAPPAGQPVEVAAPWVAAAPSPAAAAPLPDDATAAEAQIEELRRQVAELEARCAKLAAKAVESERETWAHLKARSEAEAAAAEVREDTVRKLKDARKIANVELMRAMEEATRKGVMLKEELVRTERERKEALASLAAANEELAREREAMSERVRRAASEEAARVLGTLEARVVHAEAERDRTSKLVAGGPGDVATAAVEVEEMLGDIGRALQTETKRVERIEESLTRALEDLRRGESGGPAPTSDEPPTGS